MNSIDIVFESQSFFNHLNFKANLSWNFYFQIAIFFQADLTYILKCFK